MYCYNIFALWCIKYMPKEASSIIFVAVGLVNYSYSYITTSREKTLYGVRLHEVMYALFPWYGIAYGFHGAWVIVGLYCSNSNAPLMSTACMVGVFCIFISTGVVMYLFNSDEHRRQVMVEYYLCRFGESTNLWLKWKQRSTHWTGAMAYMICASNYLRQYYLATQKIPEEVVQSMWKRLRYRLTKRGVPLAFLQEEKNFKEPTEAAESFDAQLGDLYETVKQIVQLRYVWQHMFKGLSPDKQADLIQQVLRSVARSCPYNIGPDKFRRDDGAQSNDERLFFALPLCGLTSCLLDQERPSHSVKQYWSGWQQCINRLYLVAAIHLGELEDNEDTQKYRFLVQQLFILMISSLIAECSVLDDSELANGYSLWRQILGMSKKLCVPMSWVAEYFLLGRCIALSSTDEWFSAPQGLDVQQTYDFLCMILNSFKEP